jgi:hypothetical protein
MNYIREINAFMDWLETNPLEASTQTLWFHIMGIANKSGWPEWFTVANLTLQARVGVTENTLNKHRNFLVQRGRIEYRGQGKQKAGKYRLIPFTLGYTANIEVKDEAKYEVNREVSRAVNLEVNGEVLFKQKEIELNDREKDRTQLLLLANTLKIKGMGAWGLDTIYSYIGVVEVGVIELALKKSEGKHLNYFTETINSWITEGKITTALVNPIPQSGSPPNRQLGNPSWKNGGSGKPKMSVVKDDGPIDEITPERHAEMMALAQALKDSDSKPRQERETEEELPFR